MKSIIMLFLAGTVLGYPVGKEYISEDTAMYVSGGCGVLFLVLGILYINLKIAKLLWVLLLLLVVFGVVFGYLQYGGN